MTAKQTTKKRPGMVRRGAQPQTINKVAAQVAAAQSVETQQYEIRQIPLGHIQLWEEQPRTFYLTLDDIYRGCVNDEDPHVDVKRDELERIIGLAMSIKEFGMLNPPLAFALPGKNVQLMGGQRRTMAAIFSLLHIVTHHDEHTVQRHEVEISPEPDLTLLNVERIAVKCYLKKPNDITIERIGMTDNVQRDDVPIADKLRWVMKFADRYESTGRDMTWQVLSETLGLTRSRTFDWLKVVKNRQDPWVIKAIELVIQEKISFSKLLELVETDEKSREALFESWFKKTQKTPRVSLGASGNLPALKSLIMTNIPDDQIEQFENVNWEKPAEVKRAFAAFLELWEKTHG